MFASSNDKNCFPATNSSTGTPEDSDIEQEIIIKQEEECDIR